MPIDLRVKKRVRGQIESIVLATVHQICTNKTLKLLNEDDFDSLIYYSEIDAGCV